MSTVHINTAPTPNPEIIRFNPNDRRHFIGGSDARIIMFFDRYSRRHGDANPPAPREVISYYIRSAVVLSSQKL